MKVRTGFRFPSKLNERISCIAKEKGITKNALVTEILWEWLKKEEEVVNK